MNARKATSIILRLIAAFIMVQSLYFKFSAQPESIYIFSTVGMEPWGRIATGIAELIASILLLVPATIVLGAIISVGVMIGAVGAHIFILGIEVQGDHGQLFIYAMVVLVASVILIFMHASQFTAFKSRLSVR